MPQNTKATAATAKLLERPDPELIKQIKPHVLSFIEEQQKQHDDLPTAAVMLKDFLAYLKSRIKKL